MFICLPYILVISNTFIYKQQCLYACLTSLSYQIHLYTNNNVYMLALHPCHIKYIYIQTTMFICLPYILVISNTFIYKQQCLYACLTSLSYQIHLYTNNNVYMLALHPCHIKYIYIQTTMFICLPFILVISNTFIYKQQCLYACLSSLSYQIHLYTNNNVYMLAFHPCHIKYIYIQTTMFICLPYILVISNTFINKQQCLYACLTSLSCQIHLYTNNNVYMLALHPCHITYIYIQTTMFICLPYILVISNTFIYKQQCVYACLTSLSYQIHLYTNNNVYMLAFHPCHIKYIYIQTTMFICLPFILVISNTFIYKQQCLYACLSSLSYQIHLYTNNNVYMLAFHPCHIKYIYIQTTMFICLPYILVISNTFINKQQCLYACLSSLSYQIHL